MSEIVQSLTSLVMLVLLQAVLGFDNLLYISLESKRAPADQQKRVRFLGITIAVGLRIVLLMVLIKMMGFFKNSWGHFNMGGIEGNLNFTGLITLLGGIFILYTAVKEIMHMMHLEESHGEKKKPASVAKTIGLIVTMNLVFSFDSILSAMAITDVTWIMVTAILISGVLMIVLADTVSDFLQKNRMYEVLGLFVLLIVGVLLISEGGHLVHLKLWGHEVHAMSKATFYFVITVLVLIDIVQTRYQKKLLAKKAAAHEKLS